MSQRKATSSPPDPKSSSTTSSSSDDMYNATAVAQSSQNGSKHDALGYPSSPSRNGVMKPKRSLVDYGRLYLLRHRGKPYWLKRLLVGTLIVALVLYVIIDQVQRQPPLPVLHSNSYHLRTYLDTPLLTSDFSNPLGNRILFQEIPNNLHQKASRKIITGPSLLQLARYTAKPIMMGFLLQTLTEAEMKQNYNMDQRHHSQLKKLPTPGSTEEEDFITRQLVPESYQTVRIDPRNFIVVQDVSSSKIKKDEENKISSFTTKVKINWSFANKLVQALGKGVARQKDINNNSKDYNRYKPDLVPDDCEPQYDWQTQSFPNCMEIHQIDVLSRLRTNNPADEPEGILLARGGYRDVWFVEHNDMIPNESEVVAMKTLLYEHPYTERNMDRHRRDALATDRLTGSPNALNLYGYCANTGIYEFAKGGSLEDALDDEEEYKKWDTKTKMKYAYQVAQAIADVHNIDKEGVPSMSHTDISTSQFVSTNDGEDFVINDFNRARFLFRKKHCPTELCKFEVGSNKGRFRSPEEYAYKPETEKIDTYSMGNIFYVILTGIYPLEDMTKDEAKAYVKKGGRPKIEDKFYQDSDPLVVALIEAIQKCWVQDPEKRATSRQVEQYLRPFAMGEYKGKKKKAAKKKTLSGVGGPLRHSK